MTGRQNNDLIAARGGTQSNVAESQRVIPKNREATGERVGFDAEEQ
jgi:hypothetical protein